MDPERPLLLIADDNPELVAILEKRLAAELECDISTASDGAEALEKVRAERPDAVILDVMMPRMNGWEVCKAIRADAETSDTPIVMLTGIGETLNEMTSTLYGADDYVDKPFDFIELVFKVKRLLGGRGRW